MDCVFCKIIAGELPSYKVYEDDNTLAFLDINPVNPGHILIVPKRHFANIEEADEQTLSQVIKIVKKIGFNLKNNLAAPGYNIGVNNELAAGQTVPHLHFHLIPRLSDDGLKPWPHKKYQGNEAQEILNKIKII